jgi:L-ascorbate metabolism protein UlaG (beta-lactamase superfamily)
VKEEAVYLRPDVIVEPLFNQWYAWSYLMAPATAAMYVANSHLKIMQSFVAAPQVHVAALKNPAMLGGPFLSYGPERVGEVRELMSRTAKTQARLLELAAAIKALDDLLQGAADGCSLEPLYRQIPAPLRGYVELVYDLHNRASFRLIEGLLYRSPYYDAASQSVALSLVDEARRPFAFSTPKLPGDGSLHLGVPFDSEGLRALCRMKDEAAPYETVREALGVGVADEPLFRTFFTDEPPPAPRPYEGAGVRVRYFGHACVLIESARTSVLCDPVVSYHGASGVARYTFADLPERIDYALITHNHQDHCMFETLLQLRHRIRHVVVPRSSGGQLVDPSLKLILRQIGFDNVVELDELESVEAEGGRITGLPFLGEHADLCVRTKSAYLVSLEGRTIVCAADSNNVEPRMYDHLRELCGEVDVLFVGMECDGAPLSWLYGPLMTRPLARKMDQSRRLDGSDYEKAIDLVGRLRPRRAYVYAMGQEPWLKYLTSIEYTPESRPIVESDRLVAECRRRGVEAERLYVRKEIFLDPS